MRMLTWLHFFPRLSLTSIWHHSTLLACRYHTFGAHACCHRQCAVLCLRSARGNCLHVPEAKEGWENGRSVQTRVVERWGRLMQVETAVWGKGWSQESRCRRVYSLDLRIPREEDRSPEVCSYIQADITNLDDLIVALRESSQVDAVFRIIPHRIGFTVEDFNRINTNCTKNVLEACQERLIYTKCLEVR